MKRRPIAEAFVEGGDIVIRLPIANIQNALKHGPGEVMPSAKITDVDLFAKDVVMALNAEKEDGSTTIHDLFDQAFLDAIDDGSQGVAEPDL